MKLWKPSESLEISLDPFKFGFISVFPVRVSPRNANNSIQFVPLGLVYAQMTRILSEAVILDLMPNPGHGEYMPH